MQYNDHDHQLCPQAVQIAHKLAKGHIAENIQHVAIGCVGRWRIENHQKDTRDNLYSEQKTREKTQAKGRIKLGYGLVIKGRSDVKPKALGITLAEPGLGSDGIRLGDW